MEDFATYFDEKLDVKGDSFKEAARAHDPGFTWFRLNIYWSRCICGVTNKDTGKDAATFSFNTSSACDVHKISIAIYCAIHAATLQMIAFFQKCLVVDMWFLWGKVHIISSLFLKLSSPRQGNCFGWGDPWSDWWQFYFKVETQCKHCFVSFGKWRVGSFQSAIALWYIWAIMWCDGVYMSELWPLPKGNSTKIPSGMHCWIGSNFQTSFC